MKLPLIKVLSFIIFLCFSSSCKETKPGGSGEHHPAFQLPEVEAISEQIAKDPNNAKLYFERGNVLHQLREDTLALNDFKKAVHLDSTRAEYFSAIGDLMFEHKDLDGSVQWIAKAIELNPNDPLARLKIAKMFIYTKDYTRAFSEINTVLRQHTLNPEGYFLKGIIYKDLKDTAKAISSFQTAIQIEPEYKDAIIQLGTTYSSLRNPIALQYFNNAFRLDTTDVFPLYARAMFYQDQNQYEQAKKEYRNCLRYNPDYANAYFNTGWILMQQDSLEKAWRQFDIVTKLEPTDAEAYYNRGLCSELMGKPQEAIGDYKQAITFKETYKEPQDGLKRLGGG